jgi:hypothetical protein
VLRRTRHLFIRQVVGELVESRRELVLHLGNDDLPALPLPKKRMTDAHEWAQSIRIQARIIELRRVAATTLEAYRLATIARFATGNAPADAHVAPLVGAPRKGA